MFARIASRSPRVLASTSTSTSLFPPTSQPHPHPLRSQPFSSTSHACESKRLRKARLVRKAHIEKKALLVQSHLQNQPDPVLGYNKKIGGEIWERCLLKRTLLDRDVLWEAVKRRAAEEEEEEKKKKEKEKEQEGGEERKQERATVERHYNFGLNEQDVHVLSQSLPHVSMMRDVVTASGRLASQELNENRLAKAEGREIDKKKKLMRILDLGNADSKGIQVENVRRIVKAFGKDENDTGSPEVVAAILTARIHSLLTHLVSQPRDIHNRRALRAMIQDRAKVLKYLKVMDVKRYENCLLNIGVEPRAVEGEVVITKKALRELIRGE